MHRVRVHCYNVVESVFNRDCQQFDGEQFLRDKSREWNIVRLSLQFVVSCDNYHERGHDPIHLYRVLVHCYYDI
jgi:hypothetical protein